MQQVGNCCKFVYDNSLTIIRKAPTLIGAANVGGNWEIRKFGERGNGEISPVSTTREYPQTSVCLQRRPSILFGTSG